MNVSPLMSSGKKKKSSGALKIKPFTNGPLLWHPIWQQFCVLTETAHLLQAILVSPAAKQSQILQSHSACSKNIKQSKTLKTTKPRKANVYSLM